jgi:hypothetical protein
MKARTIFVLVVALVLAHIWTLIVGPTGGTASAIKANPILQAGEGYELSWYTIDSGGYTFSTGGGYQLGGTIGQPDAGVLSGGAYTLIGGFWSEIGQVLAQFQIYLPLIMKNY